MLAISVFRGEKLRFLILRTQLEASAAPGEPILVDDWLLNRALLWKASPSLGRQLVYVRGGRIPAEILNAHKEIIVTAPEGDPLLGELQAHGFVLILNLSQATWAASGKGFHLPGGKIFHIYFCAPAHSPSLLEMPGSLQTFAGN
jgi:hypothetical protein